MRDAQKVFKSFSQRGMSSQEVLEASEQEFHSLDNEAIHKYFLGLPEEIRLHGNTLGRLYVAEVFFEGLRKLSPLQREQIGFSIRKVVGFGLAQSLRVMEHSLPQPGNHRKILFRLDYPVLGFVLEWKEEKEGGKYSYGVHLLSIEKMHF